MKQLHGGIYIIIVWLLMFYLGANSILYSRFFLFSLGCFVLVIHFFSNKGLSKNIISLLFIWIIINLTAMVYLGSSFVLFRLIIMTVNMILLPYALLKGMGVSFWYRFERILYLLTMISIPLYLLNIVFQEYFNGLTSFFAPITKTSLATNLNYWSALIYINATSDNYYGLVRNSGFMWEPGAFAMMIVWALVYNWLTKGARYDKRTLIYIIALITTFSTAGYLALLFLLVAFYIKKISFINTVLLSVVAAVFYLYVYQLTFMGEKINQNTDSLNENIIHNKSGQKTIKVSRFQGGYYALLKTSKYPLGYGLVTEKDFTDEVQIYGTNGLGSLLVMWGIPAFIYLIFLLWKYFKTLNIFNVNKFTLILLFCALMVMFFSNPIAGSVFVSLMFITPLTFNKGEIENFFVNKQYKNKSEFRITPTNHHSY